MKISRLPFKIIIGTIIVLSCYGYTNTWLYSSVESGDLISKRRTWNVPTVVLEILVGEFKGLLADLLTMEAGSQLGQEIIQTKDGSWKVVVREQDWEAIIRIFSHSLALDPRFLQTHLLVQSELAWAPERLDQAMEFLKIGSKSRHWDWQLLHFMGFNTYYFLNKPGEAGKIFLEAAKTPYAPSFLAILGSRLAQKGGETEAAIILMKSMLINKTEEDEGYHDMVDRLRALEGVRIIEIAAAEFSEKFDRNPITVAELIDSGHLQKEPANPYNDDYCIDPEGGVHFDNLNCPSTP